MCIESWWWLRNGERGGEKEKEKDRGGFEDSGPKDGGPHIDGGLQK